MYSEQFQKSLALVEAAREKNLAMEPERMTAEQKEQVLSAFHPDYREDQFEALKIGPNAGDRVPHELADMLQAHSRITADSVDLSNPDYDTDVLIIGVWNGVHSLLPAYLQALLFLEVMNWYDGIVIDRLWVGHSRFWIIPGTEEIPFVQTWPQVLRKRGILTLIWIAGAAIVAGIIVLLF